MEDDLFQAKRTKQIDRGATLFLGFAMLLATMILGAAILTRGSQAGFTAGNTAFLPLVMQPQSKDIQWTTHTMPYSTAVGQAVIAEVEGMEYLYLFGGGENFGLKPGGGLRITQTRRTTYTEISPDGSLGAWSGTVTSTLPILPELPWKLHGFTATAVQFNDVTYIYLLGGYAIHSQNGRLIFNNSAFCAKLGTRGEIANWTPLTNVGLEPSGGAHEVGVAYHATVVENDRIYLIGGMRRSEAHPHRYESTKYVFSASLDNGCQDLYWEGESKLPYPLQGHTAVTAENGNIYVIGGKTNSFVTNDVYRAELDNGRVNSWIRQTESTNLASLWLHTAVSSGDFIYVFGGAHQDDLYSVTASNVVYRTRIGADDEVRQWDRMNFLDADRPNATDNLVGAMAVASKLGRLYIIGGAHQVGSGPPIAQNKIYWAPLVFFSKSSEPSGEVFLGDKIVYELTVTSNNVRDVPNLTFSDTLPHNTSLISAPGFSEDDGILTRTLDELPIQHEARFYITVEVNNTPPTLTADAAKGVNRILVPSPTPPPTETPPIRPTDEKVCVVEGEAAPNSGTPRPKPTCTPMPPVTGTAVATNPATPSPTLSSTPNPTRTATTTPSPLPTATDTPVDTPSPTPTPTAVPPVWMFNQATVCFEDEITCIHSNLVENGELPYQIFLPFASK